MATKCSSPQTSAPTTDSSWTTVTLPVQVRLRVTDATGGSVVVAVKRSSENDSAVPLVQACPLEPLAQDSAISPDPEPKSSGFNLSGPADSKGISNLQELPPTPSGSIGHRRGLNSRDTDSEKDQSTEGGLFHGWRYESELNILLLFLIFPLSLFLSCCLLVGVGIVCGQGWLWFKGGRGV